MSALLVSGAQLASKFRVIIICVGLLGGICACDKLCNVVVVGVMCDEQPTEPKQQQLISSGETLLKMYPFISSF